MALCLVYSDSLWWMLKNLIGNNEPVIRTSFSYRVYEGSTCDKHATQHREAED